MKCLKRMPCQMERMDVVTKGMGTLLKTSNKSSLHVIVDSSLSGS